MEHVCEQRRYSQPIPPPPLAAVFAYSIHLTHRIPADPPYVKVQGDAEEVQNKHVASLIE